MMLRHKLRQLKHGALQRTRLAKFSAYRCGRSAFNVTFSTSPRMAAVHRYRVVRNRCLCYDDVEKYFLDHFNLADRFIDQFRIDVANERLKYFI